MTNSSNVSGIEKAIELHQKDELEKADIIYARILKRKPDYVDALHMRGVLKLQQKNFKLSEHLLFKALQLSQDDPWIHFHLAELLAATDRHELALARYEKAIKRGAHGADVFFMYGNSLLEFKRITDAIAAYQSALNIQPDDDQCRLNLANALEASGDLLAAIQHLAPLATQSESPVPLKLQLVELYLNAGQALMAHETLSQIKQISCSDADQVLNTAKLLHRQFRLSSVHILLDLVIVHHERLSSHQFDLMIGLLNDTGRFDKSHSLLNNRQDTSDRTAWSWFQQGVCEQVAGNFQLAANCHLSALDQDPMLGAAAYSLAGNGNIQIDKQLFQSWLVAKREITLSDECRSHFEFAIASVHDKRKDLDTAFKGYMRANALIAKKNPFDPDLWDNYIDGIIETFSDDYFARQGEQMKLNSLSAESSGKHLVFIVGMPRSGSTLLEQLLVSNAGLIGLGEHYAMREIFSDIPEITGFTLKSPYCSKNLLDSHVQSVRKRFLSTLPSNAIGRKDIEKHYNKPLIVDKMLGNFLRLGVLALMFPNAIVLHSSRNSMATSVSCFINSFSSGLSFTYDLYNMGRAWQAYQKLMKHWHHVLPMKILDVHYESLVSDPDTQVNNIIEFLKINDGSLVPDNADISKCTNSYQSSISTASFWQARQPVSTSSVNSWTRFENYLDPLREGLNHKKT